MRRFLFIVLILLLSVAFSSWLRRDRPHPPKTLTPLYRIMQLCGAKVVEGEFHYWASLGAARILSRRLIWRQWPTTCWHVLWRGTCR